MVTKTKASTARSRSTTRKLPIAHAVGRRKSAVARIWLRKGSGLIMVNGKEYTSYFDTNAARFAVSRPFYIGQGNFPYDVDANVSGGGLHGQADAIKLGIARAFVQADDTLKALLRKNNLLTVDSRLKERKKPGQPGARKKFQFVKR